MSENTRAEQTCFARLAFAARVVNRQEKSKCDLEKSISGERNLAVPSYCQVVQRHGCSKRQRPLWVKSRHRSTSTQCPLYLQIADIVTGQWGPNCVAGLACKAPSQIRYEISKVCSLSVCSKAKRPRIRGPLHLRAFHFLISSYSWPSFS